MQDIKNLYDKLCHDGHRNTKQRTAILELLENCSEPVTAEEVMRVFGDNNRRVRELIFKLIPRIPTERTHCACGSALESAVIS
jgi:hypothetical protein